MIMDFTLKILVRLLEALKRNEYSFVPFKDFFECKAEKIVILRHDVDKLPYNSLKFAQIQSSMGIKGTYYFRIVKESYNTEVIEKISELGHEIGYHYEDLALSGGDFEKAFELYNKNLSELRKYYPVETICMHGSPLSKWDNKDLWKKYSYKENGVNYEPYFDLDFSKVFYITDTGRRWDGGKVSVRDKVSTNFDKTYKTTNQIIEALNEKSFPEKAMITFHPQRWTDNILNWSGELVKQKAKNVIKKAIVKKSK